jgi:hypothetical protein
MPTSPKGASFFALPNMLHDLPGTSSSISTPHNLRWTVHKCPTLRHSLHPPVTTLPGPTILYSNRINYRIFRQITRTPNFFDIPFDVQITRMTPTSSRVRKYRLLLTENTGVIPKMCLASSSDYCIDNVHKRARYLYKKSPLLARHIFRNNSCVLGQ